MKNDGQPIRDSVPWNFWCTKDPRWLNNIFLFSTENWAEQLKKPPCILLQNSSVLVEDYRLLQHFLLFPRHLLDNLSFHLHNGELIIDINMVLTVRVYPAFNVKTLPYEDAGPKWQLDQGLIGVDPGVRFIHIFYLFLGQTQVAIRPSNPNFRIESQMIVLKVHFSFLLFLY